MRPIVFAMMLMAMGCRSMSPTAIQVPAGERFDLAIGESARINGTGATVTFLSVEEDSRCPVGALIQCVWAGNGRVRLRIQADGGTVTVDLNTTLEPKEKTVGNVRIQLSALNPEPFDVTGIPKNSYRVSLVAKGMAD